jgi:hypothetical protein
VVCGDGFNGVGARGACGLCGSGQPKAVTKVGNGGRFATTLIPERQHRSLRDVQAQTHFIARSLAQGKNVFLVAINQGRE